MGERRLSAFDPLRTLGAAPNLWGGGCDAADDLLHRLGIAVHAGGASGTDATLGLDVSPPARRNFPWLVVGLRRWPTVGGSIRLSVAPSPVVRGHELHHHCDGGAQPCGERTSSRARHERTIQTPVQARNHAVAKALVETAAQGSSAVELNARFRPIADIRANPPLAPLLGFPVLQASLRIKS